MYNIWQPTNITRHEKHQQNTTNDEKKSQCIESKTKLPEVLELLDKDIKIVIETAFHMFKIFRRNIKKFWKTQISRDKTIIFELENALCPFITD